MNNKKIIILTITIVLAGIVLPASTQSQTSNKNYVIDMSTPQFIPLNFDTIYYNNNSFPQIYYITIYAEYNALNPYPYYNVYFQINNTQLEYVTIMSLGRELNLTDIYDFRTITVIVPAKHSFRLLKYGNPEIHLVYYSNMVVKEDV